MPLLHYPSVCPSGADYPSTAHPCFSTPMHTGCAERAGAPVKSILQGGGQDADTCHTTLCMYVWDGGYCEIAKFFLVFYMLN